MSSSDQESGDIEFANALRLAAAELQSAHVELHAHAQTSSRKLIEYILSDQPLSKVDRELLAQFLAGDFRAKPGRKARSKEENEQRRAVYSDYKNLMAGMKESVSGRPNAQVAVDMLCVKYARLSREQIELIVRHRSMRVSQVNVTPRKKTPG